MGHLAHWANPRTTRVRTGETEGTLVTSLRGCFARRSRHRRTPALWNAYYRAFPSLVPMRLPNLVKVFSKTGLSLVLLLLVHVAVQEHTVTIAANNGHVTCSQAGDHACVAHSRNGTVFVQLGRDSLRLPTTLPTLYHQWYAHIRDAESSEYWSLWATSAPKNTVVFANTGFRRGRTYQISVARLWRKSLCKLNAKGKFLGKRCSSSVRRTHVRARL